ncbi:MAG: putative quinol monooxygenase [Segniliparus sp.]|uniref:putative quinol monooxygenase n=1 Tax=Segniliparus sp. TaxID=2804064 RepID=UPI003F2E4EAB
MSIVVVAVLTPKPERRDEVRAALLEAVAATHQEPGCELYSLNENEAAFVFVERWASREELEAHLAGPVLHKLRPLFDDAILDSNVQLLKPVEAGDPAKSAV